MNEYQIAGLSFAGIIALWHLAYILCWFIQWSWSWVDDSKMGKVNTLVRKVAHLSGFEDYDGCWDYKHKKSEGRSDGFGPFYAITFGTGLLPIVLVVAIEFYPIALSIAVLILMAHLARFSRRHKKIFDEHVKDKSAHK